MMVMLLAPLIVLPGMMGREKVRNKQPPVMVREAVTLASGCEKLVFVFVPWRLTRCPGSSAGLIRVHSRRRTSSNRFTQ